MHGIRRMPHHASVPAFSEFWAPSKQLSAGVWVGFETPQQSSAAQTNGFERPVSRNSNLAGSPRCGCQDPSTIPAISPQTQRNWGHQQPLICFQTQRNWVEQHLLELTQNRPTRYEVLGVHVRTDASTSRTACLRRVARMRNVGDRPFSSHEFDRTSDRYELAGTAPTEQLQPRDGWIGTHRATANPSLNSRSGTHRAAADPRGTNKNTSRRPVLHAEGR